MPTFGGIGFGGAGLPWATINEGSSTGVSFSNITDGGKSYRMASYTSTSGGTLVVSKAGYVEILVCGAGGGGGGSGHFIGGSGGAGGFINRYLYLIQKTYPITVGTGGSAGLSTPTTTGGGNGGDSSIGDLIAYGGGGGSRGINLANGGGNGGNGGSGGGFVDGNGSPGLAVVNKLQGNDGNGIGGGGAGGVAVAGAGAPGITSTFTGSSTTYCMGGYRGGAATTNKGDGAPNLAAGQNGVVYIRWQA